MPLIWALELRDPGPRKFLIHSSHTDPERQNSSPKPRKETQLENGTRARRRNTLSPNLEPEKSLWTMKLEPKERTKCLDLGHTKDICLGPKIRLKKIERTRKTNTVWPQKGSHFCPWLKTSQHLSRENGPIRDSGSYWQLGISLRPRKPPYLIGGQPIPSLGVWNFPSGN